MMKQITEEMGVHESWYEEAENMTLEELPVFIEGLLKNYGHDYGTIVHAITASGIAAMWAANKAEQGGITGYQVGAVMWEFIRKWNYSGNKTGLKLIDYDNFLYPQYEENYSKTISESVWGALKKEASNLMSKADEEYQAYLLDKAQYEVDVKAFVEKYPDYYERKAHYDHLGMGTGVEWKAEQEKIDSGFEFAPNEPYSPVNSESPGYQHWKTIVSGAVPFGYRVSE